MQTCAFSPGPLDVCIDTRSLVDQKESSQVTLPSHCLCDNICPAVTSTGTQGSLQNDTGSTQSRPKEGDDEKKGRRIERKRRKKERQGLGSWDLDIHIHVVLSSGYGVLSFSGRCIKDLSTTKTERSQPRQRPVKSDLLYNATDLVEPPLMTGHHGNIKVLVRISWRDMALP